MMIPHRLQSLAETVGPCVEELPLGFERLECRIVLGEALHPDGIDVEIREQCPYRANRSPDARTLSDQGINPLLFDSSTPSFREHRLEVAELVDELCGLDGCGFEDRFELGTPGGERLQLVTGLLGERAELLLRRSLFLRSERVRML